MPLPLTLRRTASSSALRDTDGDALRGTGVPAPPEYPTVSVLNVPLAVRLVTARTDRHVSADVKSLRFRSAIPGGFASCEIELDRPLSLQPDEIAYYGQLHVYDGRNGETVWQGRMEDPGRGAGMQGEVWTVRAVGPAAHARDRTVKLIYVDRAHETRWSLKGYSCAEPNSAGGEDQAMVDANDLPGMRFRAPRGTVCPSQWTFGRVYRELADAGQSTARVSYHWDAGFTSGDWIVYSMSRFGIGGVGDVIQPSYANTAGGSHVGIVVTDFPAGDNIVEIGLRYVGGGVTVATDEAWALFSNVVIMARRYNKSGTVLGAAEYTANTVTADKIVADLLGRLLNKFDGANASVAACTYAIEQLAYPDGVTSAKVLDDLMAFEPGFYWAAWEGDPARFEWAAWPSTVRYEASAKDGFDSPGSAGELYNAVTVRWREADGRLRRVQRTSIVQELIDAGLTRESHIDLGDEMGTYANAVRAGDQFLAEHASPPNAGTLTVMAPIFDNSLGQAVQPWEIRPGCLIRVRDVLPRVDALNPTDRDAVTVFRLVAVDYDAASNTARLELDSSPKTVEQMLAKVGSVQDRRRR